MKKKQLVKVEPVRLKPFLGMQPGKWLTILYAIIIVLIVFLVGFLPGILNGRMRVNFTSAAGNAAVYVDGQYKGGTPFTTWIESGEHEVEFRVYGQTIDSFVTYVRHPVFLTWLWPRCVTCDSTAEIPPALYQTAYTRFLSEVEAVSAVTSYDPGSPYEPVYTSYAQRGIPTPNEVVELAFAFISCSEMLEDAMEAARTLAPDYDFSIQKALFSEPSEELSAQFAAAQIAVQSTVKLGAQQTISYGNLSLSGHQVLPGTFSTGTGQTSMTYAGTVSALVSDTLDWAFYISDSEITEYQFALFLEENPVWALSNLDYLVGQGLTDSYYLSGISTSTAFPSNRPVRNISFEAALAFCAWLSEKTGRTVFIPTETQWSAALSALDNPTWQSGLLLTTRSGSIDSMLGGVWEFTSSVFVPMLRAQRLLRPDQAEVTRAALAAYPVEGDVIIKGGSYLTGADGGEIGFASRSECVEIAGFRVAWL